MRYILFLAFAFTLALAVPAFANYDSGDSAMASPAAADKTAAHHNDAGIKAYNAGDFAGAAGHFREAVKIAPNFAEAHFNLGLALHGAKKHQDAAVEFKLAKKLAPNNKAIADSKILDKHVNM